MADHKVLIPGRFRYASAHDMYQLLGVKALPKEGMPVRLIHGVQVYVKPLGLPSGEQKRWSNGPVRNFQGLRVMAICHCGQHLAVGRMFQHKCKK